jgi:hypothetical protein
MHMRVPRQVLPQKPQFISSVRVSMQGPTPPQRSVPPGQLQVRKEQTSSAAHAAPHVPQ